MKPLISLICAALSFAGAMAAAQGIYPGDAVRVNGETISYQRFQGFYVEYRNARGVSIGARGDQLGLLTEIRQDAMDLLIEQVLTAQAAEEAGIEADPAAVDKSIEDLRTVFKTEDAFRMKLENDGFTEASFRNHVSRIMAAQEYLDEIRSETAAVTDAELEDYYRVNAYRLTLPAQVRVRHILISWKPMGKPDDRAYSRSQMADVLKRARAGEDFAALAREISDDAATRASGGDTGFFYRGQMAPAFEEAAFALESGEVSDVVETPFGVHIIRLEERRPEELLPLDDVREQLRAHVQAEKAEQAVRDEVDRLKSGADIKVLIPLGSADGKSRR